MDRFVKLRRFLDESDVDLKYSLDRVATDLAKGSLSGRVAFVVGEVQRRLLLLDLDTPCIEEWPASRKTTATTPDLVIYAKHDTLCAILRGELSPLKAMLIGGLRYAGNKELGLTILRQLASSQDAVFEPCRGTEIDPWKLKEP